MKKGSLIDSNCKEEVKYNDVEKHLKDGCIQVDGPILTDCIYRKKALKKLTPNEVERVKSQNRKIYNLSSNKYFF